MDLLKVIILLIFLLAYIILFIIYIHGKKELNNILELLNGEHEKKIFTFHIEDKFIKKFQLDVNKIKWVLYLIRIFALASLITIFILLKGLALALVGAIIIIMISADSYEKVVYESGITNISKVTNFINYFVPHINSGNSADQSFLGYIEYSHDIELAKYYENKDNPEFEILKHLKQIIDIYDIAKYNEEKGISDYTYILNELSQDISQKQVYYNSFIAHISEIKPIMMSYYFGIPILIFVSFGQTSKFWFGFGGYIVSFILLILFSLFKFLIYKLQKKTIITIF